MAATLNDVVSELKRLNTNFERVFMNDTTKAEAKAKKDLEVIP